MIRRAALVLIFSLASGASLADEKALVPYGWNDVTGTRDMPWMGSGGRARLFKRDVSKPWDVMNPRGPTIETSWGSRGGSGAPFLDAGDRVTAYLASTGFLKPWPAYPVAPGGSPKAAFPYRVTIVCLEPTIGILRFDLSAAIEDPTEFSFGAFPVSLRETGYDQHAMGSGLANPVMFGTRLAYGATLLWFSPDAAVPPTPLVLAGGRARIAVKGVTLELERRGEEIVVVRR